MARIKEVLEVLGGVGLGLGTMYFLDPQRGKRRRALVRDKVTHVANVVSRDAGKVSRDLRNRAKGLVAEVKPTFERTSSDDVLCERVRAAAGHVVQHPKQLKVKVNNGIVTLKGNLSEREHARVLRKVHAVPGVVEVRDELGMMSANGSGNGKERTSWVRPTGIAVASTAAGALAAYGAQRAGLLK